MIAYRWLPPLKLCICKTSSIIRAPSLLGKPLAYSHSHNLQDLWTLAITIHFAAINHYWHHHAGSTSLLQWASAFAVLEIYHKKRLLQLPTAKTNLPAISHLSWQSLPTADTPIIHSIHSNSQAQLQYPLQSCQKKFQTPDQLVRCGLFLLTAMTQSWCPGHTFSVKVKFASWKGWKYGWLFPS